MSLSLSKKSSLIAQSEIRAMTLECARVGGINPAQGVCDTEVPLPDSDDYADIINNIRYTGISKYLDMP